VVMMKKIINILAISISLSFSFDKLQDGTVSTNADRAFNSEKNLVVQFAQQYAPAYTEMLLSSYSSPNQWSITVGGVATPANFDANDKNDIIAELYTNQHIIKIPILVFILILIISLNLLTLKKMMFNISLNLS
jgi:hypothetical protein